MLDIELIRKKPDFVRERLATRDRDLPRLVDRIIDIDGRRRKLITELESLRALRNKRSKEIGVLRREGKDTSRLEEEVRELKVRIENLEEQLAGLKEEFTDLMLR
ncbi:MAG TPA: serine--tRNA ligase, partial [Aquifex aeolicus]|nr:serine--tRNA ligase [Aquifex aeolicus]